MDQILLFLFPTVLVSLTVLIKNFVLDVFIVISSIPESTDNINIQSCKCNSGTFTPLFKVIH